MSSVMHELLEGSYPCPTLPTASLERRSNPLGPVGSNFGTTIANRPSISLSASQQIIKSEELTKAFQALGPIFQPEPVEVIHAPIGRPFNPAVPAFQPRSFEPTMMARYGRGVQRPPTIIEQVMRLHSGMSANYRGDPGNLWNHSFNWLPDEQNCSFWICRLPPDVTHQELLATVTGCGRVYALHINREEVGRRYDHAGAKLVFFDEEGAAKFTNRYMANQLLFVRGRRASVRRNRNKVPAQAGMPQNHTRCLRIQGPIEVVDPGFLMWCFGGLFVFEIDEIVYHSWNHHFLDIEIRFGSYRAQAAFAYKILTTEHPFLDTPNLRVHWAMDPCDRRVGHINNKRP